MATLRIDLRVRDYELWRTAFDKDAGGRQQHGALRYRIFRAVDDDKAVAIDLDFGTADQANEFLEVMREEVWPSPDKAPAKVGTPEVKLIEMVEQQEY
jgi:hypothetical protein